MAYKASILHAANILNKAGIVLVLWTLFVDVWRAPLFHPLLFRCSAAWLLFMYLCCCCNNYAFKSSIKRPAIIKYLKLLAVCVARVEHLANSYVLARMLITSCSVKQVMCIFFTKESSSFYSRFEISRETRDKRPFPSSRNPLFQAKANCKTFFLLLK